MITLTPEEARAVLTNLKSMTVNALIKDHPLLLSAIMKLNGTPLHEPGMGMPTALSEEKPETWRMYGDKISLIKAVRTLTESGLYESKELVEKLDPNGRGGISFDPNKLPSTVNGLNIVAGFNEARKMIDDACGDRVRIER